MPEFLVQIVHAIAAAHAIATIDVIVAFLCFQIIQILTLRVRRNDWTTGASYYK